MSGEKQTFENKIEELEGIVGQLEDGSLDLEDCLKLFEKGVKKYKDCKKTLEQVEKKVTKLNDDLKEENL